MAETETKPIDRWLGLFALAVGVALFMLPKTEPVIIGCSVLIWGALLHPCVKFWWIEDRKWRQVFAVIILTIGVVGLGLNIKPEKPHDQAKKTAAEKSLPRMPRSQRILLLQLPHYQRQSRRVIP